MDRAGRERPGNTVAERTAVRSGTGSHSPRQGPLCPAAKATMDGGGSVGAGAVEIGIRCDGHRPLIPRIAEALTSVTGWALQGSEWNVEGHRRGLKVRWVY